MAHGVGVRIPVGGAQRERHSRVGADLSLESRLNLRGLRGFDGLAGLVGIAGGKGEGLLFRHGQVIRKVAEDKLAEALMEEIEKL